MKFASLLSRTSSRRPFGAALVGSIALALSGCGNPAYLVEVHRAEQHFREAKELGAEEHAPYEYYSAKVRIEEAHKQAAHAEYGAASQLSHEANEFALEAIESSKQARTSGAAKP